MITMLIYSHIQRELSALSNCGNDVVCKISDDDWDFLNVNEKKSLFEILEKEEIIDISCVDVAAEGGIDSAERLRDSNHNMSLILLTNPDISPMTYIKPTIMASSLLVRPLNASLVKKVFFETISDYLNRIYNKDNTDCFALNDHGGKQLIPYKFIRFFESRNKKIFVSTASREYSFYDTLDNLEKKLPDTFIRCHRSFIVSKSYIRKISISKSIIELDKGFSIPLSRSYKNSMKEYMK